MAITLAFYSDSGLTTPFDLLSAVQSSDGTAAAVDRVAYLGSTVSAKKFQAQSSPGTAQVTVSIADAAGGSGLATTAIKLATSNAGLTGATAGASLNLGTQILSGTANAVAVHVRIDAPAIAAGSYSDLSLTTNLLVEVAA